MIVMGLMQEGTVSLDSLQHFIDHAREDVAGSGMGLTVKQMIRSAAFLQVGKVAPSFWRFFKMLEFYLLVH